MSESSSSMEWRLEAFEPRPSLWRLVEQSVPGSERVEIKEVLGEDLVDETLDLHNEVSTFLDTLQLLKTCLFLLRCFYSCFYLESCHCQWLSSYSGS